MSTLLIFIFGIVVFTIATLASLWTGYLALQRVWVDENPGVPQDDDDIRPLIGEYEALRDRSESVSTSVPTS